MDHDWHSHFSLRPAWIAAGVGLFATWLALEWRYRRAVIGTGTGRGGGGGNADVGGVMGDASPLPPVLRGAPAWAERHFGAGLAILTAGFALTATAAKFSQLRAFELNGQDFWLFQDMLAQMERGGFLITRYAPQAAGWVQHGIVHPMLSWVTALPLAYAFGPTTAALLYGPIALAGAAVFVALLARPRFGALPAWFAAAAFLVSSQVSRILMYDVHPEVAYPLGVLAWAWAAGWGTPWRSPGNAQRSALGSAPASAPRSANDNRGCAFVLIAATLFTMGIKEDSFTVLPPLIAVSLGKSQLAPRRWLFASLVIAVTVTLAQIGAVHAWTQGAWGPSDWQGLPVTLPGGAGLVHGERWDGAGSIAAIAAHLLDSHGGFVGALIALGKFLVSRPWLSLLIVAPWVVRRAAFWAAILPLACVFALLEDPGKFINYYSAPLLGSFWLFAITSLAPQPFPKPRAMLWLLGATLVLGGSGIDFYRTGPRLEQARQDIHALLACLPAQGVGVVSSRFINEVPAARVFSDHLSDHLSERPVAAGSIPRFYLFSATLPSFELPPRDAQALQDRLARDPQWNRLGPDCRPLPMDATTDLLLFTRRS